MYPWHSKTHEQAPSWAQDPFNPGYEVRCLHCGEWEEVVRPGKTQCNNYRCNIDRQEYEMLFGPAVVAMEKAEDDGYETVHPPCDVE